MSGFPNRLVDDISRLFTEVVGVAQGVKREGEEVMRHQIEKILRSADVVSREEFEVVKEMAVRARDENEDLNKRLHVLESRIRAVS